MGNNGIFIFAHLLQRLVRISGILDSLGHHDRVRETLYIISQTGRVDIGILHAILRCLPCDLRIRSLIRHRHIRHGFRITGADIGSFRNTVAMAHIIDTD